MFYIPVVLAWNFYLLAGYVVTVGIIKLPEFRVWGVAEVEVTAKVICSCRVLISQVGGAAKFECPQQEITLLRGWVMCCCQFYFKSQSMFTA